MTEQQMRYDPACFRRVFVDRQDALRQVVRELGESDALGVDLEMVQRVDRRAGGIQEWVHVLALIQIASQSLSVVIDPVRCRDLSPLGPLLGGSVRKIFLGGGQDASLLERTGIPALNVVDVGEIALAVFGRREDGMAALARRIFNVSLDKTVRRADWLARPLNPALLTYAYQDAELTLLIYRWFQQNYPEIVSVHERPVLDPRLGASTPEWLREAAGRSSIDPLAVVMERGLDPERDAVQLTDDVRAALLASTAPRQINRLLRVAGDLGLAGILPEAVRLAGSRSSLVRASAARAVGKLAEPDEGMPLLAALKDDPIEDVRKAAEAAARDLLAPRVAVEREPEAEGPSLGDGALSMLQKLMADLQDGEED